MKFSSRHRFTRSEAVGRINEFIEKARTLQNSPISDSLFQWNPEGTQLDFSFSVQNQHISGQLQCLDYEVFLTAHLPLKLRLFQSKIEEALKKMLEDSFK